MARPQDQLNLPPQEVLNHSSADVAGTKDSSAAEDVVLRASYLFDVALENARVTSYEASLLLGVSESFINKMRSKDYPQCVSLVQLLKCGPIVCWHFHRALHAKEQFAQLALRETMQALSLLAVGLE